MADAVGRGVVEFTGESDDAGAVVAVIGAGFRERVVGHGVSEVRGFVFG
jgi:hypothetical protein